MEGDRSPADRSNSVLRARPGTSRACDRCRKRRARCDDSVPCKNCTDARAACTHDSPVLKRGPRPRRGDASQQSQDLEARVRSLEHLISSIPGGASGSSNYLSLGELNQIWSAALPTPGSDANAHESVLDFPFTINSSELDAISGSTEFEARTSGWSPQNAITEPYGEAQLGSGSRNSAGRWQGNGLQHRGTDVMVGSSPMEDILGSGEQNAISPSVNGSGHDLLYTDQDGQTKYLGASSGMPLLDKLKTRTTTTQRTGHSMAEEWISLSAAIGVEVAQQQLPQVGPSPQAPAILTGRQKRLEDDVVLWSRLLNVVPPDLVDLLVRAFFTISHLLWPILHAPTFMAQYSSSESRRNPSFVALVMSICSLSSRYTQDDRLSTVDQNGETLSSRLIDLSRETILKLACDKSDLDIVQALFNMSVVQEGTARSNLLWVYLSQALSMAIDLGLHRRVDEYSSFSAVDIEVRKRTMWALYSQDVKASCTFGRPPMLRLTDLDLDEPSAVDDVYISVERGIELQPPGRPSVMAGFVAAVRLHMILEKTIRRINRAESKDSNHLSRSFRSHFAPNIQHGQITNELDTLQNVTEGLSGDWNYTPATISDPDSVRFFQKTRVFTLQHFIRLLINRHRFSEIISQLGMETESSDPSNRFGYEIRGVLQQIVQSALGIVGTYSVIDIKGRLGFFGAHAIAQLTQAGAGLIGVLLHLRSLNGITSNDRIWQLAMQGLPVAIHTLRQLGKRRPAGSRSAQLLAEFSHACRIPVFTGSESLADSSEVLVDSSNSSAVEVPMLRALPRRNTLSNKSSEEAFDLGDNMEEWLGLALSGSTDAWLSSDVQMRVGEEL